MTYQRKLIDHKSEGLDGVTLVQDKKKAKKVLSILMDLEDRYHAFDTETIGVDLKKQSPVGNGRAICFSVYCGDDIDFGEGPKLWVDTLDAPGMMGIFEPYLTSWNILKVGHNLGGFDRHIVNNHGIEFGGWGGDTMHKVRLVDSDRKQNSLAAISEWLLGEAKVSMKKIFGKPKLKKNGEPGKVIELQPLDEIQRDPERFADWVDYSCYDTKGLYHVNRLLDEKLSKMKWTGNLTLLDFYERWWRPFGWVLSNMERRGVTIDTEYLSEIQPKAEADREEAESKFKAWASDHCPDAVHMNIGSSVQLGTFLFGGSYNKVSGEFLETEREFQVPNDGTYKSEKSGKIVKNMPITLKSIGLQATDDDRTDTGSPQTGGSVIAKWAWKRPDDEQGWGPAYDALKGSLGGKEAKRACKALRQLSKVGSIDTLLSNFIIPLQQFPDSASRVHTALNANTASGRLSSRKPNAQNQPALEKDIYEIRDAWIAGKKPNSWDGMLHSQPDGEVYTLIVADYGQLEIRVLAHLSNCKSMIKALLAGGDYHSRTALDMYEHIRSALASGAIVIEKDGSAIPSLKDVYPNERKNGKTLNFCVSEDTKALTKRGWKSYHEIRQGEHVLGKSGWVRVIKKHKYEDTELVDMWGFHVTRNHRWWAERRTTINNKRCYIPEFVQTDKFTADHRAVLSVPQTFEGTCYFSVAEVKLLAWIVTDGTTSEGNTVSVHQSKRKYVKIIDDLMTNFEHSRSATRADGVIQWRLPVSIGRRFKRHADALDEKFVLSLSPEQRAAFVEAGLQAEGWKNKNSSHWKFGQNEGRIADAFRLAFFLEGNYVSQSSYVAYTGKTHLQMSLSSPTKTRQRQPLETVGRGMSWCLTTSDGTFTIRRGDCIAITGNSVAYGKTKHGFAKEWGVSVNEAEAVINLWYQTKPEVRHWQQKTVNFARKNGYVKTLMGRRRMLHHINSRERGYRSSDERRAINSPIQGSAADIVNAAMVNFEAGIWGFDTEMFVEETKALYYDLGFRLLLQIHDELIFEGPDRHAKEATEIIKKVMAKPFKQDLVVPLPVDANNDVSWALAK